MIVNDSNKKLRSYSIRLRYVGGVLIPAFGKAYYNYTGISLEKNEPIFELFKNSIFEYAENADGSIVSCSFHVLQLSSDGYNAYENIVNLYSSLFCEISSLLGATFINYTCSLKFEDQLHFEFYFYPTYRNSIGKLKVMGIADKTEQISLFNKLNQNIFHLSGEYHDEYTTFIKLCVEFKGISFCIKDSTVVYCVDIKCSNKQLHSFLKGKMSCEIKPDSILLGIIIGDHRILGYTVYYKGTYGKPCCGWGEIIK